MTKEETHLFELAWTLAWLDDIMYDGVNDNEVMKIMVRYGEDGGDLIIFLSNAKKMKK